MVTKKEARCHVPPWHLFLIKLGSTMNCLLYKKVETSGMPLNILFQWNNFEPSMIFMNNLNSIFPWSFYKGQIHVTFDESGINIFVEKIVMEEKKLKTIGNWVNQREVMEFFNYKSTQMNKFMKDFSNILKISKIGRRTFIDIHSIIRVLELHRESSCR